MPTAWCFCLLLANYYRIESYTKNPPEKTVYKQAKIGYIVSIVRRFYDAYSEEAIKGN